jgi:hypothetical protein
VVGLGLTNFSICKAYLPAPGCVITFTAPECLLARPTADTIGPITPTLVVGLINKVVDLKPIFLYYLLVVIVVVEGDCMVVIEVGRMPTTGV